MTEVLKYFLGSIATLLGLIIAWLVYELNRQKFRLELFGKRTEAYGEFQKCLFIYTSNHGFPRTSNDNCTNPRKEAYQYAHNFITLSSIFDQEVESLAKRLLEFVHKHSKEENKLSKSDHGTESWLQAMDRIDKLLYKEYKDIQSEGDTLIKPYFRVHEPPTIKQILCKPFKKLCRHT